MKNQQNNCSYICPICRENLSFQHNSWHCINGHCFDRAKEGYVNLLPVNKKKSKDPGDNKDMMFARREFLNAGYYQHLSERVNQLAIEWQSSANAILDLGCGEGYYSHRLIQAFERTSHKVNFQGLDISRSAIKYAAKRYKELNFCIASAYELPFADNTFDLALRIFAPSKVTELSRVLNNDGILITVSPDKTHHFAIKKMIYALPKYHDDGDSELLGFSLCHQERLISNLVLNDAVAIEHFLQMTPYAWKLTQAQKKQLMEKGLACELDFSIKIYRKINNAHTSET